MILVSHKSDILIKIISLAVSYCMSPSYFLYICLLKIMRLQGVNAISESTTLILRNMIKKCSWIYVSFSTTSMEQSM